MKNVTVTLPETVARWARVWAAHHDTSLSRMIGGLLRAKMDEEVQYERAMKSYLERSPVPLKANGAYPGREETNDRAGLR